MGVRRTREQKQRVETRRAENVSFEWGADHAQTLPQRTTQTAVPVKPALPSSEVFFWRDMRRTLVAVLVGAAVLLGAWITR